MMAEPKWTPGPWKVVGKYDIAANDGGVAELVTWYRSGDEIAANAHLIAAAPDLYESCEAALHAFNTNPMDRFLTPEEEDAIEKLRSALAKARGETT